MMYDTHPPTEEKDPRRAAYAQRPSVHLSENDRSTPGTGQIRWDEMLAGT